MKRKGWWYEVSRDEYAATRSGYGSNIYALDPRLLDPAKGHSPAPPSKAIEQGHESLLPRQDIPQVSNSVESQKDVSPKGKTKKSLVAKGMGRTGASKLSSQTPKGIDPLKLSTAEGIQLSEQQDQFVRRKILELGTIERVHKFYGREDGVCQYARSIAPLVLRGEKGVQMRGDETGPTVGATANPPEPVAAIRRRMDRLGIILRDWQATEANLASFQDVLEGLRQEYRSNKDSFSAKDIQTIQKQKEEFERLIQGSIG